MVGESVSVGSEAVGDCAEIVRVEPVAKQAAFAPRPAIRQAVDTLRDLDARHRAGEGSSWQLATLMTARPDALKKVAGHYREAARYLKLDGAKVSVYAPDKLGYPFTWQRHPDGNRMLGTWSLWLDFTDPEG